MSSSKDSQSQKFHDRSAPTVSVIMNCLNCEKYLREAIDSVFAQTYEDWEIIFWEDSVSKDNSERIAKSYGSKLRYFRSDVSLPLYGSRNLALQKARGKYIAILDCDDLWLPTKLEEQIPLLERDDDIGLVCSDAFWFNEMGKEKRHFEMTKPYRGDVFSELLLSNFINTQTVVIRKEAFDSLDMWFDERLTMVGDYDAYLRISYRWKVDFVDKYLARYRVHSGSYTHKEGRKIESVELDLLIENLSNAVNGFEKNYPEGIRSLRKMRDLQLSLLDWENGDKSKARKRLRVYMSDGVAYLVLYLLMYLPYRYVYNPCHRIYTKGVLVE
jgi:glycosyltransferase involved in cell wall biosynthesis